jgi:uncharacterized C2H2 Zn-finger protein
MALKCVTCGLLFRSRNELDWHVRQEHLQQRHPSTKDNQRRPRLRPRTGGERHVSSTTIRPSTIVNGTAHLDDQRCPTPTGVWRR